MGHEWWCWFVQVKIYKDYDPYETGFWEGPPGATPTKEDETEQTKQP